MISFETTFQLIKPLGALLLIWGVNPMIVFISNMNIGLVGEYLSTSKDAINIVTSILVLAITYIRFKKEKK
jgi:hypothetical protein